MAASSATQQVGIEGANTTKITCPQCNNTRIVDISKYRNSKSSVKAKCICGAVFSVPIKDLRRFYRKRTRLPGSYLHTDNDHVGVIMVKNVSFSGLGFETEKEHHIEVGDVLGVKFMLNDGKKTEIRRTVLVKNVHGNTVGAEFCNSQGFDLELCYFLMLS
jgi:hypothetical protein